VRRATTRAFGAYLIGAAALFGLIRLFLGRLPIGGFTGGVLLAQIGVEPPLPEPPPRRSGQVDEDDELKG
jgi:hypothetical protein